MGPTIIAVAGTLLGSLLTYLVSEWRAGAERRRRELADAVRAVLDAAVRLRNKQYLKVVARREGVADSPEVREKRYDARSNLTVAVDFLHTATGDERLLAVAQEVFDAADALGDAVTEGEVDAAGLRARQAHTALRTAAARNLHH